MKKKSKHINRQEWALQITALRGRLGINQAELARRMECSAMTVSRWERSLLRPSAEHFIQFGNLANKSEAWFFWEMAGLRPSKMAEALKGFQARSMRESPEMEEAHAGAGLVHTKRMSTVVGLPVLKAVIGAHGITGDRRSSLRASPSSEIIGAPAPWCPNPAYTTLLPVKGHSMEPLIRHGDILAIDSFQTERSELYDKIVVAANEKKGLCVSRLRRYENLDVLEGENRQCEPVILNKASGWRIIARVLWWISVAP